MFVEATPRLRSIVRVILKDNAGHLSRFRNDAAPTPVFICMVVCKKRFRWAAKNFRILQFDQFNRLVSVLCCTVVGGSPNNV